MVGSPLWTPTKDIQVQQNLNYFNFHYFNSKIRLFFLSFKGYMIYPILSEEKIIESDHSTTPGLNQLK
jgi:hypothetical protein